MHRFEKLAALFACLLGGLLPLGTARADDAKIHLEGVNADKLPFLKTYVTVVDEGKPLHVNSGYKLYIDQVEQKDVGSTYQPFLEAKEPIDLVAVIQVSPVMEPALKAVRAGIEKLAKSLAKHNGESRFALISYASEVKRLEDFGRPNEIARDLDKLQIDQDATEVRMVDALRVAIDLAREKPERRRIIVLFSDGIDASQGKDAYADVGKRAHEAGVVVESIGFAPFEPGRLRSILEISRVAAGTARHCKGVEEIGPQFAQTIEALFAAAIVTFGLTTSGDNAQHVYQVAYRPGKEDVMSEPVTLQLAPFEPAEAAGRGWLFWVGVVGGGLLGLILLLYIIGRVMGG